MAWPAVASAATFYVDATDAPATDDCLTPATACSMQGAMTAANNSSGRDTVQGSAPSIMTGCVRALLVPDQVDLVGSGEGAGAPGCTDRGLGSPGGPDPDATASELLVEPSDDNGTGVAPGKGPPSAT